MQQIEGRKLKRLRLILFAILVLTTFLLVGLLTCSAHAQQSTAIPVKHMHNMRLSIAQSASGSQQPPPIARYDLQLGLSLTQDFSSLAYNVTAIGQADPDGYGPAYLLNGLTDAGYWFQVGISYNWPYTVGGYTQGFGFNYEVFAPNQTSVYPAGGTGGGMNPFSGPVNSGDKVLLSLQFQYGYVIMYARDWNTSSYAIQGFDAMNASYFQGTPYGPSDANGFFTGPMTEWYHGDPSYRDSSQVTYSTNLGVSSAWMWMDQFDQLNPYWNGTWISSSPGPVDYTKNATQLHGFSYLGASESSNAYQFTTGTIVPLPTSITLFPTDQTTALTSSNKFSVSYILNGKQLTANAQNGTLVVNADNGTQVTISGISTASTASEEWILNSQAADVSLPSGANSTFCYYDLVSQQTSFAVSTGGSPPIATLTYYTAPDKASDKAAFTRVDLSLSASTYQRILPAKGTTVSISNPLTGGPTEQWATQDNTIWTVQTPNQVTARVVYNHQFLLSFVGAQANWQWVNSGTTVQVSIPALTTRSAGSGQRVNSYSIDGGSPATVQPNLDTVTISVFMNSPHQVALGYVKQFQLTLGTSVGNVAYVTPPTISGDNYWYDQGTPVTLVLNSIVSRGADTGERVQSYTINGVQTDVSTATPVSVLNLNDISSPLIIAQTTAKQFKFTVANGSLEDITNPQFAGDAGWYDAGTKVMATFDYSWNQTTGQSRTNAVSYATTQGDMVVLPRSANGTFDVALSMTAPRNITVNSVTQYELSFGGGFNMAVSQASPTKDTFYDAGTSLTVSSDYTSQMVNGNARQSLVEYALDGSVTNITRAETGRFTTPQIALNGVHDLTFGAATQYLVTFSFTDSTGTYPIIPATFQVQTDSTGMTDIPTFASWLDAGTSLQISKVMWQGIDVKPESPTAYVVNSPFNETVFTRVYDAKLVVNDVFGIPVADAQVICTLANGTQVHVAADAQGTVDLRLVPTGEVHATASNLAMAASTSFDPSMQPSASITVFASYTILAIVAAGLVAAVLTVLVVIQRKRR